MPDNLLITSALAVERSAAAKLVQDSKVLPASSMQHCVIAVYLAEQRLLGPFSVFAPYVDALPHSYSHLPMFFDEQDHANFEQSTFRNTVYDQREQLSLEYKAIVAAAGDSVWFDRKTFMWARAVVWTRAFNINPVNVCHATTIALVPMADLINHRKEPNTKWQYNTELHAFTMTATEDIEAGASVHDSYGPKTNSNYFRNFGFTLDDATDEVTLQFSPADLLAQQSTIRHIQGAPAQGPRTARLEPREQLLFDIYHGRHFDASKSFVFQSSHSGLEGILEYLRLFFRDLESHSATALLHAFQILRTKAAIQLSGFPTTADSDQALIDDAARQPPLSVRHYRAVVIRRGEKRCLESIIVVTDQAIASSTSMQGRCEGRFEGWCYCLSRVAVWLLGFSVFMIFAAIQVVLPVGFHHIHPALHRGP